MQVKGQMRSNVEIYLQVSTGVIIFEHWPVCNQTWMVAALQGPQCYLGVKDHVCRSEVKC